MNMIIFAYVLLVAYCMTRRLKNKILLISQSIFLLLWYMYVIYVYTVYVVFTGYP